MHGIDDDERQVNAVPGTKGPSRGFNDSSGKKSGDSLGQSGGRPRKSSKGNINVPHSPPGPPGGTNHHVKLPKNETTPEKDHAGNKQYRKKKPHPPPPKVDVDLSPKMHADNLQSPMHGASYSMPRSTGVLLKKDWTKGPSAVLKLNLFQHLMRIPR